MQYYVQTMQRIAQTYLTNRAFGFKIEEIENEAEKRRVFMPVTIKDVAALAGVSSSTVSRTCKDHPSISRQTKEKVRRAMAELGYEPNFQASSLATQNSRTIGIILPPSEKEAYQNSFYLEVIRGISQYCNQKQYINTVITGENEEEILQVIRTMVKNGLAEGFILLYSREQDPVMEYLYEEGLLYVLIGKAYRYVNQTIYVDNDNVLAGAEATDYLLERGHQRIAYLSGDHSLLFNYDRKSGYMLSLARRQIPYRPELCIEMAEEPGHQEEMLRQLFSGKDRPTAVLVSDDILAMMLEKVCISLGLSIPEDVSIISFNNSLLAQLTVPPLTSVDVHSGQLGVEAAAQMISHIENPELIATKIIVPHHIVERESCVKI